MSTDTPTDTNTDNEEDKTIPDGCDLYLIEPYCVSVLAFPNAVHNFWMDSMKAILGNAFIAIKEYQMKVAPFPIVGQLNYPSAIG